MMGKKLIHGLCKVTLLIPVNSLVVEMVRFLAYQCQVERLYLLPEKNSEC